MEGIAAALQIFVAEAIRTGRRKWQAGSASVASVSYSCRLGPRGLNKAAKTMLISAYASLEYSSPVSARRLVTIEVAGDASG